MSNYYYIKQDAKVRIARELMKRGWELYGFHEDESDMMIDYYNPAYWDGIAVKNGCVLVVDNRYSEKEREIKALNKEFKGLSQADLNRINSLKNMTVEKGATESEERNAKMLIEKIQNKCNNQDVEKYVVVGKIPAHMGNGKGYSWHVEKDGAIIDQGKGLKIFNDVPSINVFNIDTMQFKEEYKYTRDYTTYERKLRILSEEEEKAVKSFKNFILRLERAVNGMNTCGDGTAETEEEGLKQQASKMQKIQVEKKKKVIEPVEKADKTINKGDVLQFNYHVGVWLVTNVIERPDNKTIIYYEALGSASRGYKQIKNTVRHYEYLDHINKNIEEGKIKVCTLQEVEKIELVEKWVKPNKKKQSTKEKIKTETEIVKGTEEYTITEDVHTKTGKQIYVVKFNKTVNKEDFKDLLNKIKEIGGYYSKFKRGFVFNDNPEDKLKGLISKYEGKEIVEKNQSTKSGKVKAVNYDKLEEKINKQIETNDKRIDHLSGDFKTNTWKRIREQQSRDEEKEKLVKDNNLLNYLLNKVQEKSITDFETQLITKTLRVDLVYRYKKYREELKKNSADIDIYPFIHPTWDKNSDWYKEQIKSRERLRKINVENNSTLIKVLEEKFKPIMDIVDKPINPLQTKIKQLESEYKMQQKGDINFTPNKLVEKIIDLADIQEDEKVLEPSAGIGNIADKLKEKTKNLDVVEYMYNYSELLRMKNHNVVSSDFMQYDKKNYYDKIIMNPPFSKEIDHIRHAYECLKDGGRIVCITSPHWTFAKDRQSEEFRNWLDNMTYEIYDSDIKFEMTGVQYKILVIDKDISFSVAM